ncbi:MAG: hypothetical protein ACD_43C00172G0005 [uncultured bacterium]|nr:MAG: hypothetical protein ACD_43C00172G0005 [uncultured bacterium]
MTINKKVWLGISLIAVILVLVILIVVEIIPLKRWVWIFDNAGQGDMRCVKVSIVQIDYWNNQGSCAEEASAIAVYATAN